MDGKTYSYVERAKFKQALVSLIQNSNIPAFDMSVIVSDAATELRSLAIQEEQEALQNFSKECKAETNSTVEEEPIVKVDNE